jgi:positive regulator of sigma E activity
MSQSRRHSLEETLVSTAIGFVISTFLNMFVAPRVLHTTVSFNQNLILIAIFTVASILRGYFVRRHYNRKTARAA